MDTIKCSACDETLKPEDNSCPKCGNVIKILVVNPDGGAIAGGSAKNLNSESIYCSGHTLMMLEVMEDMVLDFLKYVPLEYYRESEDRKAIYSPKLTNIFLSIGSETDIFFRYWTEVHENWKKDPINSKKKFNESVVRGLDKKNYDPVVKNMKLYDIEVNISCINKFIKPFENFDKWWSAYNHIKHNGYYYRDEGSLKNVVESLGALFILNCFHEDVIKIMKSRDIFTEPYSAWSTVAGYLSPNMMNPIIVTDTKSKLFRCKIKGV